MLKFFSSKRPRTAGRFRRADVVMSVEHGTKTVLLDPASEQFYSLDETAQRIWNLIAEPKTPAEIVAALQVDFAVPADQLAADVTAFLDELADNGLVVPA